MDVEFDQHYLKDNSILNLSIEASNISSEDIILEIGPGKGFLTKKILKENPKKLIAIEIDSKHKQELEQLPQERLELHYVNALTIFDELEFNKIIANIPYAITEQLYSKILERKVPTVTLLHGIDFYKNIIERETRWKYFIPAFYTIQLIQEVPGNSFDPPTKVKSVLVKIELKKQYSSFDKFVQMIFLKRHRVLNNALIFSLVDSLNISKKEAKSMLNDFKFSELLLNQKVTQIKNEDFVDIILRIKNCF